MNHKKIKQFKEFITKGQLERASELIPEILTYDQYILFCEKAFIYCRNKNEIQNSYRFELAQIQATTTKRKEQELLEAEAIAETAKEEAGLALIVFEDAEASFDIMSEKAAKFCDKDIIGIALQELD